MTLLNLPQHQPRAHKAFFSEEVIELFLPSLSSSWTYRNAQCEHQGNATVETRADTKLICFIKEGCIIMSVSQCACVPKHTIRNIRSSNDQQLVITGTDLSNLLKLLTLNQCSHVKEWQIQSGKKECNGNFNLSLTVYQIRVKYG